MYFIDLKLPIACPSCSYKCCSNHFESCYKPIFSGDFCNRDKTKIDRDDNSICEHYPLGFSIERGFYVSRCLGSEFVPFELYLIKDRLNALHPFKEFHHESESIILHITGSGKNIKPFKGNEQSFRDSIIIEEPLHVVLAKASQKLIKH